MNQMQNDHFKLSMSKQPDGRKHLAEESARYRQVTGAVARIMGFA